MAFNKNETVVYAVAGIGVVLTLFVIHSMLTTVGSAARKGFSFRVKPLIEQNGFYPIGENTSRVNTGVDMCSRSSRLGFLVKTGKVPEYQPYDGFGSIEGIIYDSLRCNGSTITSADVSDAQVGVFPLISESDLVNGYLSGQEPLMVGRCVSGSSPCYMFQNIPQGSYSVLTNRGDGWYCDHSRCSVIVESGYRSIFDSAY